MRILGFDLSVSRATRGSLVDKRSAPDSDLKNPSQWLFNALLSISGDTAGVTVTPLKALGVAKVFACVKLRADILSTLPLEICQKKGRYEQVATDHRLFNVLNLQPNSEMTSADFLWAMEANRSLRSVAYAEILRDIDNDSAGLYPIEPGRMYFQRNTSTDPRQRKLIYRLDTGVELRPEDVLHLRDNSFDGVVSTDMMVVARECIGLAIAMQDNAAKFFGNGCRPSGILEHPAELGDEAQARLRKQIESQMTADQAYRLLILEEGMKFQAQRSENKDSQFLESRDQQNLEICSFFRVPPHKVGVANASPRANVEQENISFVTDTMRPICVKWEQSLNTKLFTEEELDQGYRVKFDLDDLLRGDRLSRYQCYAIGRQWSWLTSNDVREEEGMSPVKGGDVCLQPVNMIDASKATELQLSQAQKAPSLPNES